MHHPPHSPQKLHLSHFLMHLSFAVIASNLFKSACNVGRPTTGRDLHILHFKLASWTTLEGWYSIWMHGCVPDRIETHDSCICLCIWQVSLAIQGERSIYPGHIEMAGSAKISDCIQKHATAGPMVAAIGRSWPSSLYMSVYVIRTATDNSAHSAASVPMIIVP